ncbi:S-layer homology domain-containing protein [Sporosarcina aquimarina]|uniref:S-layer homology domain-containing protein n=1 Tax=Sporosarcina aquimarina TaxID=114975 RepID=A0ABU4FVW6_9BACL|nr:S-layer homology domain-containing protein [Sporosarcina aquimarina]MDW0108859.1 S-layer homology domain-containing protein [Sporosarcina aquimarina]
MKKKITAVLAAGVLTFTMFASTSEAAFSDVSSRYETEVNYLVAQKYTQGTSETTFGTQDSIKRIDAAVMVARTLGFDETSNLPDAGFSDVPKNRAWAVNALAARNVVSGKTETRFGTNDTMTRNEMAKVIASAYDMKASDSPIPFTDVNKRFAPYVSALVRNGITQGKSATTFGADDAIKRGEFAIFIYKVDGLSKIEPPEVEEVS